MQSDTSQKANSIEGVIELGAMQAQNTIYAFIRKCSGG